MLSCGLNRGERFCRRSGRAWYVLPSIMIMVVVVVVVVMVVVGVVVVVVVVVVVLVVDFVKVLMIQHLHTSSNSHDRFSASACPTSHQIISSTSHRQHPPRQL
jgi:hypothetical protein